MNVLQVQPCVVPSNLRGELPDPHTPWQISKRLFSSLQEPAPLAGYKKVQVLPEDKEWRFIWRYFHADKPTRYEIKRIWCVHERHQQRAFEFHLSNQEREATKFPPTWKEEPRAEQRAAVIDRWTQATAPFSPFQYQEADGRIRSWKETKVLPLWHGTREEICESICSSGFVYFGKTSLGAQNAGDPKSTDEGYFGSGIYFTNSPRYAADIYSKGHMLLVWVSMRHPFPVVGDPKQLDMAHLKGRGAYKHYNAHYVPVAPVADNPHCADYYPAQPGETPICDEYVVFEKAQTLPGYWIELEIALPYLMVLSDAPQFVEQLIPHMRHFLQNSEVDKDLKLRRVLGQELGILLTLQNDDDLSDAQTELYQRLTQLLIQGKIDKTARNIIVGISPPQASSSSSQALNLSVDFPLHDAAEKGDIEAMKFLLDKDPQLVRKFKNDRWTPLDSLPSVEKLKFELEKDFQLIGRVSNEGTTSLHSAAYGGYVEAMKLLLEIDPQLIERLENDGGTPLHYAAYKGHIEAMKFLLEIDPQLIGKFKDSRSTPLHSAAAGGHVEAMKFLLEKDPQLIGKFKYNGSTPLHYAALGGNVEAMKFLLEIDPQLVKELTQNGMTSLYYVAIDGHVEAMKFLLEKDPRLIGRFADHRQTPLHAAAAGGHVEAMKLLLEKDPQLMGRFTRDGMTPLHAAAAGGHVEAMKFLLEIDPQLIGKFANDGQTPLDDAARGGHVEAMKFLLEIDPQLIKRLTKWSFVHCAGSGHVEAMKLLLEKDPQLIGKFTNNERTPLHAAAYGGHVEAMKFLLDKDPHLIGKFANDGKTPLHDAAYSGNVEGMKLLLERDPRLIERFMQSGLTPLHWAANSGRVEAMKLLLEKDPQLIGKFANNGGTPLHYAASAGHVEAMKLLLEKDPQLIGKFENDGRTPLHSAANSKNVEAGKYLLSKKPDLLNLKSKEGKTPLAYANDRNYFENKTDFQIWISSVGGV